MGPIDPWSMNVWNWNPEAQRLASSAVYTHLVTPIFTQVFPLPSPAAVTSSSGMRSSPVASISPVISFFWWINDCFLISLFSFSLSLPFSFSLIQFCPFCSHLSVLCFYSALFISSIFPSNYFFKSCFLLICCFWSFTYRLVHLLSRFVTSYVKFNKRIHNIGIITWR